MIVQELKNSVKGCSGTLYAVRADVSKEEEVVAAFKWVKTNLGGVDVLINNAGVLGKSTLHGKRHKALISHIYIGILSYVLKS
jgi:Dehydrogenases with different specificities (related to short-chain alcohol dehydrogenases)